MPSLNCLAGIFIGGQSRRMQGIPKGLLQPPGSSTSLVEILAGELRAAGIPQIVLIGEHAAYRDLGFPMLPDPIQGGGPMVGLFTLLEYAVGQGIDAALAIACDMPFLQPKLLQRLSADFPDADVLVPRRVLREPLCARYNAARVLPEVRHLIESGQLRMMDLLDKLGERCVELPIEPDETKQLDDWDNPRDLPPGVQLGGRRIGSESE